MYKLELRDEGSDKEIEFEECPDRAEIESECDEWAESAEWGNEGAMVRIYWALYDADGDEVDSGLHTTTVEPNHEALIDDVIAETIGRYGTQANQILECDHQWVSTYDREGGCKENPGVWSLGGTTLVFNEHCEKCSLERTITRYGSQRNPEQADEVKYRISEEALLSDD